jgi:putative ABC transport system permease protein
VQLARGREFTAEEARGAAPLPAIIAYHVWQNQFHGTQDVIGRPVMLNGHTATVVGVGPPGFVGIWFAPHFEVCVPIEGYARVAGLEPELADRRAVRIAMLGQLAPHASVEEARAEFDGISARMQREYPDVFEDAVCFWPRTL